LSFARHQGYLQFLELVGYDLLLSLLNKAPRSTLQVALVLVTEDDIQTLGNWPLTDEQLTTSLRALLTLDPVAVGLDIYRDLAVPPGTDDLMKLLKEEERIIAIEKFPSSTQAGIPPPRVLQGSQRTGFSDLVVDTGGVVRRALLFQSNDRRTGYAFALRLALVFLQRHGIYPAPGRDNPSHLRLGESEIVPMTGSEGGYVLGRPGGYQVLIEYRHGPSPFAMYRLTELLNGSIDPGALNGKVVILGVAAESVKDYFTTPFALLDQRQGTLSGPVIHAQVTQQLIDGALRGTQPLRTWNDALELAWLWLWIGLGFLAGWHVKSASQFSLLIAAGSLLLFGSALAAYAFGWWIPLVPNLIGWLSAAALSSALLATHRRRDQQLLMNLFSRQVSLPVAKNIWHQREEIMQRGQVRPRLLTATTLFADLQGFTRISEQMAPEPFFRWLNTYMSLLTDVIMEHGGVLDDYAGDGIKANFGVPVNDPAKIAQEAAKAVNCALRMCEILTGLNRQCRLQNNPCVGMRIGIHTGQVVAGTLGSATRMKYTTVGYNVNLASRLESLRDYPEPVAENELVADHFELIDAGRFELKGFHDRIQVYQVTRRADQDHRPRNIRLRNRTGEQP